MIMLATYFFRDDNEIRVKESNLKISEVIALKVRSDFLAVVEKINLMGTTMLQEFKSQKQKMLFTDLFFTNDRDFIYVGIAERPGTKGTLQFERPIYNKTFMAENQLSVGDIEAINRTNGDLLVKAFNGDAVVYNFSDSFKISAYAFPFREQVPR
jgi:adenylate cyclase